MLPAFLYQRRMQAIAAASMADAAPASGYLSEKRRPRASVAYIVMVWAFLMAATIALSIEVSFAQASALPGTSTKLAWPIRRVTR